MGMSTDRFSSHEDIEWAEGPYKDGGVARYEGHHLKDNPYRNQSRTHSQLSWDAGWSDEDMNLASRENG